jgi:hypothetical protein
MRVFAAMVCVAIVLSATALLAASRNAPDERRVEGIAQMLPDKPQGFGPLIGDRKAWGKLAAAPRFKNAIAKAEELLTQPIPELTDELYLDYSRTGNRTRAQRVIGIRHGRYPVLALAECIENKGRFIPAIEQSIRSVCGEKTWVLPAHDYGEKNFKGTEVTIDLRAARYAWNLATIYYWLGDRLSEDVRKLVRDELERRAFTPFEKAVNTGKPRLWWLNGTNNWNAVCLAGVTGSALTMIESPQRRAFFVAAAEKLSQHFLSGFTPDGYCSEGVGYWNYGFGHYVMLSESVRRATGGKIDMLDSEKIERLASFGHRMEITPGQYPAFADCRVGSQPSVELMAFLSRRYGFGLEEVERKGLFHAAGPSSQLFSMGLFAFNDPTMKVIPPKENAATHPLRDWFPDAGILICRPAQAKAGGFGVAIKGGNNAEHHNHNDVGSYLVTFAGQMPLADPGSEVYTARTFSSRRYESDVLNSFGHPVPRIAGKLQENGPEAAAKVTSSKFTDSRDTLVLNIKPAYDDKRLKTLDRTFIYSRGKSASLTVVDSFEFDTPLQFETALITFSKWEHIGPDQLLIGEGDAAVYVNIDSGGADFNINATEIKEDVSGGLVPVRLGISLIEPTSKGTIKMTITPAKR